MQHFSSVKVLAWNNLPADVNFSTINTFKRSTKCVDFSTFL